MNTSKEYTTEDGRKFGLTLGIAFAVLSAILIWRGHLPVARVLGSVAGVLVVMGVVLPRSLRLVDAGWMKFAELLSRITTPIFMGVVYFGVFTTFGFARRRLGGGLDNNQGGTAWAAHEGGSELDRQF